MKKIPTLYVRDPDDRAHVLPEVTPGCEWVTAGEGVATRKYDGTCVLVASGALWARRELKAGVDSDQWPPGFAPVDYDEVTGKTTGWVPVTDAPEYRWHREAADTHAGILFDGTYELVGPKINGNPENCDAHQILRHGQMIVCGVGGAGLRGDHRTADPLDLIEVCRQYGMEGIVWHHPDGRMAKLKVRDYDKGL